MTITFRRATQDDLPHLIQLLADDPLGAGREDPSHPINPKYLDAFAAIDADTNQLLLVAVDDQRVMGTFQLSFIPGITRTGTWRGQIEGVRVHQDYRGQGIGEQMFEWGVEECRRRGCALVQLTTDKSRPDAHRFYDKLGFEASHIGYKRKL